MHVFEYATAMHGRLIAAARSLLGWSQDELAQRAGVSRRTVISLEGGKGDPKRSTETKVVELLQAEGIEFTEAPERMSVAVLRGAKDRTHQPAAEVAKGKEEGG